MSEVSQLLGSAAKDADRDGNRVASLQLNLRTAMVPFAHSSLGRVPERVRSNSAGRACADQEQRRQETITRCSSANRACGYKERHRCLICQYVFDNDRRIRKEFGGLWVCVFCLPLAELRALRAPVNPRCMAQLQPLRQSCSIPILSQEVDAAARQPCLGSNRTKPNTNITEVLLRGDEQSYSSSGLHLGGSVCQKALDMKFTRHVLLDALTANTKPFCVSSLTIQQHGRMRKSRSKPLKFSDR